MTQPAAVPSCCCSCFFGWCLLKCKTPTHTQNFMLSYISNYGKVMHRFPTSGSENHVFTQRMSLDFHVLFCHKNLRNYNASCFKRLNKLIFFIAIHKSCHKNARAKTVELCLYENMHSLHKYIICLINLLNQDYSAGIHSWN